MRYIDCFERDHPGAGRDLALDYLCPCDMYGEAEMLCGAEGPDFIPKELCKRCWEQEAKE